MISNSLWGPQLHSIDALLRRLRLLAEWQRAPSQRLGASDFRGLSYREQYNLMIRDLAFDFRLGDQSLLRLLKSGGDIHTGSLSYSYFEAPVSVASYEQFVGSCMNAQEGSAEYSAALSIFGDELMPDYEQYVLSADLKASVTPVRYDCKASDYRTGIHPACHVHFGIDNHMRIATRHVLTPIAFVLFVIRQRYPREWEAVQRFQDYSQLVRNVRDALDEVDAAYWQPRDNDEMYLM